MNDKVLVRLFVPSMDTIFDVYIPINSRICNDIILLKKAISEMSNGEFIADDSMRLYDRDTGEPYDTNLILRETNIRNGSGIILL